VQAIRCGEANVEYCIYFAFPVLDLMKHHVVKGKHKHTNNGQKFVNLYLIAQVAEPKREDSS